MDVGGRWKEAVLPQLLSSRSDDSVDVSELPHIDSARGRRSDADGALGPEAGGYDGTDDSMARFKEQLSKEALRYAPCLFFAKVIVWA